MNSDSGPVDLTGSDATVLKRSLPYDDVFESAAELMRYPLTTGLTTGDEKGGVEADSASSGAADVQLYDDMTAFGRLDCVKAAAGAICQVQGASATKASVTASVLPADSVLHTPAQKYTRTCPPIAWIWKRCSPSSEAR